MKKKVIDPQELLRLRNTLPILEVIGADLLLVQSGQTPQWKGRCPFHEDTVPSFVVHAEKGVFHCFGCGVGGDIFGWMMRFHKLSFPEAVQRMRDMGKQERTT